MEIKNKEYWEKNASKYGTSVKSTTKHLGIKKIEISILETIIKSNFKKNIKILELGCGNGINLMNLSKTFRYNNYTGIDYSPKMIKIAKKNKLKNVLFEEADITKKEAYNKLGKFDFIFTNRCLINLKSEKKIRLVINLIKNSLNKGGKALFLENFVDGHKEQNFLRKILHLKKRNVAPYNQFINLNFFLPLLKRSFIIEKNTNYSSLYDLILYVLNPSINKNKILYNSKIQKKLTYLFISYLKKKKNILSLNINSGQNNLILCKKK